ncbi:putative Structural maintenance of chromosomes protein 6B [Hypsibius exemplaris]|uniref:Structural maintenance of chromosomes protein 6B n=1 Tax=Hypsibius exemplaris TaxID=2072580 RepID=A0A9X6NJP1_HYPEX|nr:putative Structural maintenance of chromosomes protein 6B [Hypsibius exemplaris]
MQSRTGKNKENTPMMDRNKRPASSAEGDGTGAATSLKKQRLSTGPTTSASRMEQRASSALNESFLADGTPRIHAGRILRVDVKDFMVYGKKTFTLGQYVNFVTGPNGSGKSSFAAAIAIGLGQSAAIAGRKGLLSSYIRTGQRSARIRIVLSNDGHNAYKPELWGKQITVERTLTRKEAVETGYRITSEDGKTCKTKKDELMRILKQLKIQMDNPVFFLNQQMAKEYLNPSNQALYQFFFRASGFNEVEKAHFEENPLIIDQNKNLLQQKEKDLAQAKKELQTWKLRSSTATSTGDLQARLEDARLQKDLLERKKRDEDITSIRDVIQELTDKVEATKDRIRQLNEPDEQVSQMLRDTGFSDLTSVQGRLDKKIRELNEVKKKASRLRSQITPTPNRSRTSRPSLAGGSQSQQSNHNVKTESLDNSLNASNDGGSQADSQSHSQADSQSHSQADSQVDSLAQIKVLIEKHTVQHQLLDKAIRDLEKTLELLEDIPARREQTLRELDRIRRDITSVETAVTGWFSHDIPADVLLAISAANWVEKPIGPLGIFLKTTREDYTMAADQALRDYASAFIVIGHLGGKDVKQLKQIFKDAAVPLPHLITLDVDQASGVDIAEEPDLSDFVGAVTLDDVVSCSGTNSKFIKTALRKGLCSKQIVLVKDSLSVCPPALENVREIYDAKGCLCTSYSISSPTTRPVVLPPRERHAKLSVLWAEHERLVSEVAALDAQVDERETTLASKKNLALEMQAIAGALGDLDRQKKSLLTQKYKSRPPTRASSSRITHQEQLTGLELNTPASLSHEWDTTAAQIQTLEVDVEQLRMEAIHLEFKKNESERQKAQAAKKMNTAIKTHQTQQAKLVKEIAKHQKDLEDLEDLQSMLDEKFRKSDVELDYVVPRDGATREGIAEEIKALEAQEAKLMAASAEFSKEKCLSQIKALEDRIEDGEDGVRRAREIVQGMDKNAQLRMGDHHGNIERGALMAREKCKSILMERGYTGKLEFDTEAKTVQYEIATPNNARFIGVDRLSGGERAYAMAAFLGAMWEPGTAPFRVLDEIEVFMDTKNREYALKCLVQRAAHDRVQAIFLSPTDFDFQSVIPADVELPGFITRIETGGPKFPADPDSDSGSEE